VRNLLLSFLTVLNFSYMHQLDQVKIVKVPNPPCFSFFEKQWSEGKNNFCLSAWKKITLAERNREPGTVRCAACQLQAKVSTLVAAKTY
jgi:hypothetical protein